MDPPEHAKYRDLVNRRFTPRAVRALEAEVSEIAEQVLQEVRRTNSFTYKALECDFVTDVASRIPIDVIAALLGVPKPDRPQLFRWTNQTIGSADPEFQLAQPPRKKRFAGPAKLSLPTSLT